MMKMMAIKGNLDKPVISHSLRTYGVTKMFAANVPDKLMMEGSGHRSTDGMRQYKRTSALQEIQVCKALESRKQLDIEKNHQIMCSLYQYLIYQVLVGALSTIVHSRLLYLYKQRCTINKKIFLA